MISIDLEIPGDTDSIRATATWLDDRLRVDLTNLKDEFDRVGRISSASWTGEAGDAFRDALKRVRDTFQGIDTYCEDAAIVMRAYAFRLEHRREVFAEYLDEASEAGLIVTGGNLISFPVVSDSLICSVLPLPQESTPEQQRDAETYRTMIEVHNRISAGVSTWWADQAEWNAEHVNPLLKGIEELVKIDALLEELRLGNGILLDSVIETVNLRHSAALSEMVAGTEQFAKDIVAVRQMRKSGDPSVRNPAEKIDLREAKSALGEAKLATSDTMKIGKFLKFGGPSISLVTAGIDVAQGEDPARVASGLLGGIAVAAGTMTLLALTVELAPIAAVVITVVAGTLGTMGGENAYDYLNRLDRREQLVVEIPDRIVNSSTVPGSWVPRFVF